MILEVDAGNTRIKWRLLGGNGGVVQSSEAVKSCYELSDIATEHEKLDHIRVSSVRGEAFGQALSAWAQQRWGLAAEFALSKKCCAGVNNSYSNVSAMGVDRWLGMLAAYNDAMSACCIINCGTAITLDIVDASGQHVGGYIVPGFNTMRVALLRHTKEIGLQEHAQWLSPKPGHNTEQAVNNGILAMVLGFVANTQALCGLSSAQLQRYVTGGDGQLISQFIETPHQLVPDLVLNGLALGCNR